MTDRNLIVIMAVMPILTALAVGTGGVWLTGDLRVFGLVGLAAAIVGAGLVGYFNWRAKLQRRILGEAEVELRQNAASDSLVGGSDERLKNKHFACGDLGLGGHCGASFLSGSNPSTALMSFWIM